MERRWLRVESNLIKMFFTSSRVWINTPFVTNYGTGAKRNTSYVCIVVSREMEDCLHSITREENRI